MNNVFTKILYSVLCILTVLILTIFALKMMKGDESKIQADYEVAANLALGVFQKSLFYENKDLIVSTEKDAYIRIHVFDHNKKQIFFLRQFQTSSGKDITSFDVSEKTGRVLIVDKDNNFEIFHLLDGSLLSSYRPEDFGAAKDLIFTEVAFVNEQATEFIGTTIYDIFKINLLDGKLEKRTPQDVGLGSSFSKIVISQDFNQFIVGTSFGLDGKHAEVFRSDTLASIGILKTSSGEGYFTSAAFIQGGRKIIASFDSSDEETSELLLFRSESGVFKFDGEIPALTDNKGFIKIFQKRSNDTNEVLLSSDSAEFNYNVRTETFNKLFQCLGEELHDLSSAVASVSQRKICLAGAEINYEADYKVREYSYPAVSQRHGLFFFHGH